MIYKITQIETILSNRNLNFPLFQNGIDQMVFQNGKIDRQW